MAKKDFVDVMELRILGWDIILDYLRGPNAITRVPTRGRQGQSQRRWCDNGSIGQSDVMAGFERGGRGHDKEEDGLQKLEKARKQILPQSLQKEVNLVTAAVRIILNILLPEQ